MSSGTELAQRFFTGNSSTYDPIADVSTLGLDRLWKRQLLQMIPDGAGLVVDQACGTGILTLKIARKFPRCRVIGVELRDEYVAVAQQKARALRLTNVEFVVSRAEDVVLAEGSVDCITSSYLAKYAELDPLVANAGKMLRKDGMLILHELTYPTNPVFLALWKLHFRFLQTYGAWKYPEWATAFRELPEVLQATKWTEELVSVLGAHHFNGIKVQPLPLQVSTIISAKK